MNIPTWKCQMHGNCKGIGLKQRERALNKVYLIHPATHSNTLTSGSGACLPLLGLPTAENRAAHSKRPECLAQPQFQQTGRADGSSETFLRI